jgi:hypothetical protein
MNTGNAFSTDQFLNGNERRNSELHTGLAVHAAEVASVKAIKSVEQENVTAILTREPRKDAAGITLNRRPTRRNRLESGPFFRSVEQTSRSARSEICRRLTSNPQCQSYRNRVRIPQPCRL